MKSSFFLALSVAGLFVGCQAAPSQQVGSIDLKVSAEADSLVECDPSAKISWSIADSSLNSRSASSNGYSITVYARVPRPDVPGFEDLVSRDSYSLLFNTTELELNVTWAAGTALSIRVEAEVENSDASKHESWAGNVSYTVQPGSSQACIIPAHQPVVLDTKPLMNLSQCETSAISWTGGAPPYAVSAYISNDARTADLRASGSLDYTTISLIETNATSFDWPVDYAAGVNVSFVVDSASGASISRPFTIGTGSTACTIPDENKFKTSSALSRAGQLSPWAIIALLATPLLLSV